uniref:Mitochondrial assembly of ribosomal large subunit protein 1 n=1 Tax=Anopheles marajoara TaxID=58244 RepID=A0A2M4BYP0_9DIPT
MNFLRVGYVVSRENRTFASKFSSKRGLDKGALPQRIDRSIAPKYQVFRDTDAPVIFDVEEERLTFERKIIHSDVPDKFKSINLSRAEEGVFDLNDLVAILKLNNAMDMFVCTVPKHIKYVDYMCVVSGRNRKHMLGIAETVKKAFKIKRHTSDQIPKIEGESSSDWMAMDLGNIAIHIFSPAAREHYDLESLWTVGSSYDGESNKPNEDMVLLFEKHTVYLNGLKSLNTSKRM